MRVVRSVRRRWLPVVLACLGVLVAGLLTPGVAGAAAPARSNPIWMPVHTAFGLDCAGKNPGCTASRSFYSIDVVPAGQIHGHTSYAKVYAMGGGTVHIGDAHGTRCGSTSKGSFGTWVWIDHGNGIKSRYGHLSKILVRSGTRVAAGTPIGVVGATGKAKNCTVNYLDFELFHGKLKTADVHKFVTLQACTVKGKRQTWPTEAAMTKSSHSHQRVHYKTWPQVPRGTQFPASSGSCIPRR